MDFICGKCNAKMKKTIDLLIKGCENCGSKVFTTKSSSAARTLESIKSIPGIEISQQSEQDKEPKFGIMPEIQQEDLQRKEALNQDHIPAIKLREKGVYEVNIEGLFRNDKNDPVVLSGKSGIYRVEFLGKKKKKEKGNIS